MNVIIALIIALTAIFGQAPAATSEPLPASQVGEYVVTDTEALVLENDSKTTWQDYMGEPQVGTNFAYTWVQTYNFEPDELSADMLVLQSLDLDRTWHVYRVDVLSHA